MDTRDADCARGLVSDIDRQLIVGAGPPDSGFGVVIKNCRDRGLVIVDHDPLLIPQVWALAVAVNSHPRLVAPDVLVHRVKVDVDACLRLLAPRARR
jgi:hypothetical protein